MSKQFALFLFNLLILFLYAYSCGSEGKEEVLFTGYDPLDSSTLIQFDTLKVSPILVGKEIYGGILDTSYYWDIYEVNRDKKIFLKCSSYSAYATDSFADTLIIDKFKFSILDLFNGNIVLYRIVQILEFKFDGVAYLALIGKDKSEGGNRAFNNKVILARFQKDSVNVFCPPLNLDHGLSNVQGFLSNYFCNINHDEYLDFLQWDFSEDTINIYSLVNGNFVKQKEFIKLYKKDPLDESLFIDKAHSNWPYPYFKSLDKFPDAFVFEFPSSYY